MVIALTWLLATPALDPKRVWEPDLTLPSAETFDGDLYIDDVGFVCGSSGARLKHTCEEVP